ncbi:14871_t:CDS:1, partial [Cetraspora pellucida]
MNGCAALKKTDQEPEYKKNPHLPISSIGITNYSVTKDNLPAGCALMTDTLDGSGNGSSILNSKGITHIIHAGPKERSKFPSDEEFVECVVKSVQNCIILAERNDFEKLAVPLVGGEIFLGKADIEKLVEGIIRGVANQLAECQKLKDIVLIDFDKKPPYLFLKKVQQLEKELFSTTIQLSADRFIGILKNNNKTNSWIGQQKTIKVKVGDIRDKNLHKCSAIVNAANTYYGMGSGLAGAIKAQTGDGEKIDAKAKELINEFNSLIDDSSGPEQPNPNPKPGDNPKPGKKQPSDDSPGPTPDNGNGNNDNGDNGKDDNQEPTDKGPKNDTDQSPNEWRGKLKNIDPNLEQSFTDTKIAEWQQEKGPFNTAEGVKNLLENVKENNDFLTEISSKHSAPDLNNLITNKAPQEVITIIKRFEYDQLNVDDKKNKDAKIETYSSGGPGGQHANKTASA